MALPESTWATAALIPGFGQVSNYAGRLNPLGPPNRLAKNGAGQLCPKEGRNKVALRLPEEQISLAATFLGGT